MPQPLCDLSQFDFEHPMFDLEEIRKWNPQRYEMEQLTAIVHVNPETHLIVGYKDITEHEFWCRGHMPGFPLMPGVILCECAAQVAGFYARRYKILGGDYLGFGGMNEIRFRAPVYPNSRLVVVIQMTKLRPNRLAEYDLQGFVDNKMVFSGSMIGVPIHREKADDELSKA